jgi:hypothetical protein
LQLIPRDDSGGQGDIKYLKFENAQERITSDMADEADAMRHLFVKGGDVQFNSSLYN